MTVKHTGTIHEGKRPGRNRDWAGRTITKVQPLAASIVGYEISTNTEGVNNVNEKQTVDHDGTGGTFTLTYAGQETATIDWDGLKTELDTALQALSNVTAVTITGSDGYPMVVEFTNPAGSLALMTFDDALLTGDTTGVTVVETQAGVDLVAEVTSFWIDGDTGTFTLTYSGQTTGTIAATANAALIDTRLQALSNVADVAVTGTGTILDPFVVTFTDPSGSITVMTGNDALLTKTIVAADRAS